MRRATIAAWMLIPALLLGYPTRANESGLASGIRHSTKKLKINERTVELNVVEVDLNRAHLVVLTPQSISRFGFIEQTPKSFNAHTGLNLDDYRELSGAAAVLSGGYLSSYEPVRALGFVKANGRAESKYHSTWIVNGVACFSDRKLSIFSKEKAERMADNFKECLQAGPILVANGSITFPPPDRSPTAPEAKLANAKSQQSFICEVEGNRAVLGVSSNNLTTAELSAILAAPVSQGGLQCINSLRLTGGATAGLSMLNATIGDDDYLLPDAIGVIPVR